MSNSNHSQIVVGAEGAELTPSQRLRVRADAMARAATECCHQHERTTRLLQRPAVEAEHRVAAQLCRITDTALEELTGAYEKSSAKLHPEGEDEVWWRKANALWHASREYLRHHSGCDHLSRKLPDAHAAADFGALQIEYELEASALLVLRQAVDAYCKARPDLH